MGEQASVDGFNWQVQVVRTEERRIMKFMDTLRKKHGTIKRGDPVIVNSVEGIYIGSFRDVDTDSKVSWGHMILCDDWAGNKSVIVVHDAEKIIHHADMPPILDEQLSFDVFSVCH